MVYLNGILIVFSPFFTVLFLVGLSCYFLFRKKLTWNNGWSGGLFLLFVWAVFVGMVNRQLLSVLSALVLFGYFVLSVCVQHCCQTEEDTEKVLRYIFFLTLVSGCAGVLEHFNLISRDPCWWKYLFGLTTLVENEDTLARITGTFGNPNLAASWYGVMILAGLYFFERTRGRGKILFFSGVILLVGALLMTESRGALIGLVLGLVIYDFLGGNMGKMMIRLLFLGAGLAFFLIFPETFPRGDFLSSTIDLRWAIWENCFNMFLKKPLVGWGAMGIYFADNNVYQYLRVLHAHNTVLSLAVMLGMVGLLIFFWMEWSVLRDMGRLYRSRCRLVPLLAAVQGFFIGQGIFDFTIMDPQIGVLFISSSAVVGALSCSYQARGAFLGGSFEN